MRQLPSGTVTLLFTDIEGSTRMLQELGRETYARALMQHRRLLRETLAAHGGVEVEMQGDSFHFAFAYARDAVAAAVDAQRALAEYAWELQPIKVRIGVHTGEPSTAEGLFAGIDVHRAARIMSAAHGGQILVSQRTADLVEGELGPGTSLVDLGDHYLKDIPAPQRLFQASADGLETVFARPRWTVEAPGAGHRRRRLLVAAGAAALVLAGVGAAALMVTRGETALNAEENGTGASTSTASEAFASDFAAVPVETTPAPEPAGVGRLAPNTVAVVSSDGKRVVAQLRVGPNPGRIVGGPGAVWVAVGNNTIARIDPRSRLMVSAVGSENQVYDLAAGDDAVWVLSGHPGSAPQLARVEVARDEVSVTFRVDVGLSRFGGTFSRPAVAVGTGGVWVTDPYPPGTLRRVSPSEAKVVDRIVLGTAGKGAGPALAVVAGSVWANAGVEKVVRVDGTTRRVVASVAVSVPSAIGGVGGARDPGGPVQLAASAGALWLITQPASYCCPARTFGTGTLQRIDLASDTITGLVPLEGHPTGIALGLGAVWVATRGGTLYRFDPVTLAVRAKLDLPHAIGGVAVGADAVWITLRGDG